MLLRLELTWQPASWTAYARAVFWRTASTSGVIILPAVAYAVFLCCTGSCNEHWNDAFLKAPCP